MNHDEDMLRLTLAINHSNASPEASGSDNSGGGGGGCRFKGVVLQQNGHWGAQIYHKHQRIWLGTFKTEAAAAMAYDSAALKLKAEDGTTESARNLEAGPATLALEARFQSHFSTDDVLAMIKDGSYQPKLDEYCRTGQCRPDVGVGRASVTYTQSFEKELTPSDVGKLNRLVIPKKYAARLFPRVSEANDDEALELEVIDTKTMRRWSFRYGYWKSSQSFVLTKGWNKFVKDKELKTKDVVIFYKCQMGPEAASFYMIDVRHCQPQLEGVGVGPSVVAEAEEGEVDDEGQEEENVEVEEERRVIKLFGVDIQS